MMANTFGYNKENASKNQNESNALFKILSSPSPIDISKDIRNAVFLELNLKEQEHINKTNAPLLKLTIPVTTNNQITFELHNAKIVTDKFSVITDKNEMVHYTPGLHYQGTVSGTTPSLAAWSFFDNTIMAVFSCNNQNYVLGLWNDKANVNNTIYILYKESDLRFAREFKCGVTDQIQAKSGNHNGPHLQSNQCIKIYFECDYQMFLDQGGVTNVTNYVTGMFNVVQLLYNNETINTELSQVYVWTSSDPYIPYTTSNDLLNNFQAIRTTFNGNVAHLLTTRNLGAGGLAYLDIICDPSNAYGISNIDNTYSAYPNYSWTVEVVTHELGHNFGSHHTHWCGWTGGAIDDCYAVEGSCSPGPTPTNGGTIMSYCHLTSTGILLTNGFGTQPGNAIRTAYNAASCLTACASPPQAQFTANTTNSCSAPATVTFTDQTLGFTSSWQWDINNDGTIDYTTQSPTHTYTSNGTYTVTLIATNSNGSDTIVKTNYITIGNVTPGVTTAITSGSNSVCQGTQVTFTATPVNGGNSPSYQWYVNGSAIPGETNSTYTTNSLGGNPVITCKLTSSASCASPTTATSTGINMTITPNVIPEISISGTTTICAGTSTTLTSSTVNGGTSPTYQWRVNSIIMGSGTSFTSSALTNGDIINCTLTSNANCANPATITSSSLTMTVNPIVMPSVSIAVSSGSIPTCPNIPISFTATSTNGGSTPYYQWQKNGVNTSVGISYTPPNPADGDIITCIVTSNALCLSTTTDTSNSITISLVSVTTPGVSIAITAGTNPSCHDSASTFAATPTNAGTNPIYQWFLNGFPINGAQNATYTPSLMTEGDNISCQVTSDGSCPQTVTSNNITLTVTPTATIAFVADIDVCAGTIPETVFSSTPPGASYTWTNSNTAINLPGSGTGNVPAFITSNSGSTPVSSTITVTPSINGCPGTPDTYMIIVNPTPEISLAGATLTSTTGPGYQWYLGGTPVTGATSQIYNATENGEYMVIVDGSDCPSESVIVTTASINDLKESYSFTVYPNPNDGNFFVSFHAPEKAAYTIKIINSLGELIYQKQLLSVEGLYVQQTDLKNLANGVYMITVTGFSGEHIKKVIIYTSAE